MVGSERNDLLSACIWTVGSALATSLTDGGVLRILLGLPVVFLLTGHVLVRALGLSSSSLFEHVVWSVAASLAAAVAGGFVLNAVGLLSPPGWAVWSLLVVLGGALAARRRETPASLQWSRPAGLSRRHVAIFAVATSLITGAYALAVRDETNQRQFRYTEFWMLPQKDKGTLSLGIGSREDTKQTFEIDVSVGGKPFTAISPIEVTPGELWTREIPMPRDRLPEMAEARLYRVKDMRLYRRVTALILGPDSTNEAEQATK